jgi:two-component system, NarL family, sensor histidine kinase UhpB
VELWDHRSVSAIDPQRPRSTSATVGPPHRPRLTSLYGRLFRAYTAVLAGAVLLLIFAPVTLSVPTALTQLIWILGGFALMLVVFWVLLHRLLGPLERLTMVMKNIDPLAPGRRIDVGARAEEIAALTDAFNEMLDRLEGERRESARRALAAQEGERQRIARELHDEIGQVLTAVMLRSETLVRRAPEDMRPDLEDLREAARRGAEDVRQIAQRLRPEALDELGLQSALLALCNAVSDGAGIEIARNLERDLSLNAEQDLVIYRVAQESITNVVRHAHARRIEVTLRREGAGVVLVVVDDGVGLPSDAENGSNGIRGMRERALLVGAELAIGARPQGGTEVRLRLPGKGMA